MEYIVPILLTLLSLYSIIVVMKKIEKALYKDNAYRQSDIHKILKPFYLTNNRSSLKTQMDKMLEKNSVNVMIMDDKAYWVLKNVFYTADFVDGDVDPETTRPIDTSNMSKEDINKMLFILDKLGDGNSNDSGGTR